MNAHKARARELFEQALDREIAEERREFLHRECGSDAELLLRVEALLGAHTQAGAFLPMDPEVATPNPSPGMTPSLSAEQPGESIGRYKLIEKIGEGGMGVVYLAQQEQPVRRRVALKIIKLGMDTRHVVARFEAERQALALMDHPNIAQIYDAGMTGDAQSEISNPKSQIQGGRPYFVMEFVDGVPITEFSEKNQLTIEQRLQLLIQVCGAVQHAHQKGTIHRDLKPSNVLVATPDGMALPKVIDFGVAKAINQKLTDKTLLTQHLVMIGTPAYMSPEQADLSGLDVDTRSDIYSLGVLLYELLTGSPPFPEERLRRVSQSEMQRIIAQEEPERPSKAVERLSELRVEGGSASGRSTLNPQLKSLSTDLDWIVMKCLEKDRNRRYETANGLAADLQHFLASEPIVARPPSTKYRLQKAIQRNRLAFIAAGVLALILCAGVATSSWQAVRANRERDRAERQLQATLKFINVVFTEVSPDVNGLIGGAAPNRVLATSGLGLLEDLSHDAQAQSELPVALGHLYFQLAFVHGWLLGNSTGSYSEGLRCADEAIRLLTPAGSDRPDDSRVNLLAQAEMAAGMSSWGLLQYPEAMAHFRRMEAWADRLSRSPKPNWITQGKVLKDWARLCVSDVSVAWDPVSIPNVLTNHFLPMFTELQRRHVAGTLTNEQDIGTLQGLSDSLGSAYSKLGQYPKALPYFQAGLQVAEELVPFRPNAAQPLAQVADSEAKLGSTLLVLQQIDEGRSQLNHALQSIEALVKRDPANVGFAQLRIKILGHFAAGAAASSRGSSAPVPERRKQIAEAEARLEQAQILLRTLAPESAANYLRPELQRAESEVATAKAKLEAGEASSP